EDEEDPVDYPANGGDNDDNESSDDDNDDDDDVEKDEEDDEEVEDLAPVDPSVVPIDDHEAFDKELEAPIEDQPLPTNASPTALLPGYINNSNPKEDEEEDPEEDPFDYPANGGDNDDDESSDDDNDDDDDKDGEDDEEVEHLALVDPYVVPINDHVPSN
nr:hypothetical protein [Tanacetum cinerariifolium]